MAAGTAGGKSRRGPKVVGEQKGDRFVRQWETLMLVVEAEEPLGVQEINKRLGRRPMLRDCVGNVATTRSDLWTLVRCGFPLQMLDEAGEPVELGDYLSQRNRRGKHKNTRWTLRPSFDVGRLEGPQQVQPSSADLTALSLLRALLQDSVPADFALYDRIRALLDEVHRYLVGHHLPGDRTEMIHRFLSTGKQYLKRGPGRAILLTVADALNRRCVVEGRYRAGEEKDSVVRALPVAAWFANGRGHMLAARAADGALRTYRLDRFAEMKVLAGAKAPRVDDAAAKRLLDGAFGGFVAEPEEVRLHVAPAVAYLFDEFRFHPSQRVKKRRDGSLDVRMCCAIGFALEEWILGLGEHVEVKKPEELRRRIAERHRRAAEKHGSPVASRRKSR